MEQRFTFFCWCWFHGHLPVPASLRFRYSTHSLSLRTFLVIEVMGNRNKIFNFLFFFLIYLSPWPHVYCNLRCFFFCFFLFQLDWKLWNWFAVGFLGYYDDCCVSDVVGNIPYDATEEQLIEICQEVGPVVSFR